MDSENHVTDCIILAVTGAQNQIYNHLLPSVFASMVNKIYLHVVLPGVDFLF